MVSSRLPGATGWSNRASTGEQSSGALRGGRGGGVLAVARAGPAVTTVAAPESRNISHGLEHLQQALEVQRKGASARKVVVTL